MAGYGPAPKQNHQRERDTRRRQADQATVTRDDVVRGPDLSPGYSAPTVSWYDTWRRSPQAQLFEATDWQRLALLAPIVELYWTRPGAAALSEIRLNEERLGATYVDRLRAKIRIEDDERPDAEVVPLHAVSPRDALRSRLTAPPRAPVVTLPDEEDDDSAPF